MTLVSVLPPSFGIGHMKESLLGPSIAVIVPSTRPSGSVPSYRPPYSGSIRTSEAHHAATLSGVTRASNTRGRGPGTVIFTSARLTGGGVGGAGLRVAGCPEAGAAMPPLFVA